VAKPVWKKEINRQSNSAFSFVLSTKRDIQQKLGFGNDLKILQLLLNCCLQFFQKRCLLHPEFGLVRSAPADC